MGSDTGGRMLVAELPELLRRRAPPWGRRMALKLMSSRGHYRQLLLRVSVGLMLLFALAALIVTVTIQRELRSAHPQQHFAKREIAQDELLDLLEIYRVKSAAEREALTDTALRRIDREYEEYLRTGEPPVRDILIISGGGSKGAFGAGFLDAWGELDTGPLVRPEFDVVTGVSTGAVIAPFAFIGTSQSYADVADLYTNPEENLFEKRGALYFLPGNVSLYDSRPLERSVHEHINDSVLRGIAQGVAEDRLLLIGATNLDLGIGRVFDLGQEARRALIIGSPNRVHSILLASTAIPGLFPPVELDNFYYADGAISAYVFVLMLLHHGDNPVVRWRGEHPDAPPPTARFWVIVNESLTPDLGITRSSWTSVAARSLQILIRESLLTALRNIEELAKNTRESGMEAEFRFVSIPDDAPTGPNRGLFDREYMNQLEEIGRQMGQAPSSWQTRCPASR